MKKIYKRFISVANAVLLSFANLSAAGFADADDEIIERYVTVEKNNSSEYGESDIVYKDENGNEVYPDLIPEYGERAAKYPSAYDLRDYDKVTPVKDQFFSGSCWAYAAVSAAESNLLMKGYVDNSIDISESHLIWFGNCKASTNVNDFLYADGENNGVSGYELGGNNLTAVETLARWNGIQLEENAPSAEKMPEIDEEQRYISYFHLFGNDIIDPSDKDAVKSHIMRTGACMASYYDADEYFSEKNNSYCCNEKNRTNHAISIVGWDDSFSRENFLSPPEKDGAWLCKNSWGDDWGDNGYFYLSYYDMNLARVTTFDIENSDNYDMNYQYDGTIAHYRFFENSGIAAANVFASGENEKLSAVSFNTVDADNPYIIRVYMNVQKADDPTSGELVCEQRGNMPYAGYHTVELDKPIFISDSTYFSVVVMLEKTGSMFYMDEKPSGTGVSFYAPYYSDEDGVTSKWWDSCQRVNSNVCIKAFTNYGIIVDDITFPDENFRKLVSEKFDSDKDNFIPQKVLESADEISAADMNISDFTGIEYFTNLKSLDCSDNPITWLNLSGLKRMKTLVCKNCGVNLGDVSCIDLISYLPDDKNIYDITGGYVNDKQLFILEGNTISYKYDCGNGLNAEITLSAESIEHKNISYESYNEKLHTFICNDCGYSELQNHELTDYMPYDKKSHAKFCKQCGYVIMSDHTFGEYTIDVNGIKSRKCETCGYEESEQIAFTRGDITGDNIIDIFDFILLRKAVTDGIDGERENLACDFNADGKINISDLVSLNNYILGKTI